MFIHEDVWDAFMERFLAGAAALKLGDPLDPDDRRRPDGRREGRRPGPSAGSTRRAPLGGTVLAGGTADGTFFPPTVITDVPVTRAGVLQRGVRAARRRLPVHGRSTTRSPRSTTASSGSRPACSRPTSARAWTSFTELEVGGVIVNDIPTYRIDNMPYGGVKDSGLGREGIRWAIEDMTEIRIMVLAWPQ